MDTAPIDYLSRAKSSIGAWIDDMEVGGARLSSHTREQLQAQLASARPTQCQDGSVELVLPALSSLGVGIFQRSFRCDAVRFRVVPYGLG